MRHNQNRRSRGRSRKGPNPLSRSYESNGPDVKVRGNAAHVADKYMSLARDAHSSGDPISAENYLQHAEHYNRIVMAAQAQFQQSQPQFRDNNSEEGYDDDRQMNGRTGRDRFDYNPEGDDEGEDRAEGGEPEGDRGFRQPEHQQQQQRADDRGDRPRGPRERFQYRDRNDRNDRNDRGDRDRHGRDDRYDRDRRPDRDERPQRADSEAPAEAAPVEAPQPVAEAAAPPARRRRGRPRNGETEGEGEGISDGAAALAAFPD